MKLDAPEYMTIAALMMAIIAVLLLALGCAQAPRKTPADAYVQCVHAVIFPSENEAEKVSAEDMITEIKGCEIAMRTWRAR